MESICAFCRFWRSASTLPGRDEAAGTREPEEDEQVRRSSVGLCCRYAPRASPNQTSWAQTLGHDWCGEWEARAEERRQR